MESEMSFYHVKISPSSVGVLPFGCAQQCSRGFVLRFLASFVVGVEGLGVAGPLFAFVAFLRISFLIEGQQVGRQENQSGAELKLIRLMTATEGCSCRAQL